MDLSKTGPCHKCGKEVEGTIGFDVLMQPFVSYDCQENCAQKEE